MVTGIGVTSASAAPASPKLAKGIATTKHDLSKAARGHATDKRLSATPKHGSHAFLVVLGARSTSAAQAAARGKGTAAAKAAGRAQLSAVTSAQNSVISALPSGSRVLYRAHAVLAGLAVRTDATNVASLRAIRGVTAVYPIATKKVSNSYAVPLQGGAAAWQAHGDLGANSTIAVIDTGIDYTHANFGGAGTVAEYKAATAQLGKPTQPDEFPGGKVIGGYDLAGDAYDADPSSDTYNPVPSPDPYPLDCFGHGSHVAGTAAGYGVNANGSTYTGAYNKSTPFDSMKIGPGMAPEAKLYAFRVFGCNGSTDITGAAIERATDPNQDGDTSDHVDVINMSLGSDYGSPTDGDEVITNAASLAGVTVVASAGNAGDLYDVSGSPANAPRAIAVAASEDAYAQLDSLNVGAPAAIKGSYAAERSVAYDYVTKPDLSGPVARVTQASNLDGCDPLNSADAAAVKGKIAFVEWTDTDAARRCGSVGRSGNLVAAGAIGFIFADDQEHFGAGITGSAVIPGVLVAKSGGDKIRTQLVANTPVVITSTTRNGFRQTDTGLNDQLTGFSSRGINDPGILKPDVTAVGGSVFSTSNGTGNDGETESGTSMASPMTAGAAGLVKSLHPNWTPEQIKADLMNTANQALFTGPNHTGTVYAPNRVGAGRIAVDQALDNTVLAYVTDNPGTVSASFGPVAVSKTTTRTKTIKVENTGLSTVTYSASYSQRTSIPGVSYTVSPSSVTVGPRAAKTVTVTLTVDPSKLTKTIDPTVDRSQADLPRQYLADASGIVMLKSTGRPNLRVPVYSAPRPVATMTQPSSVALRGQSIQTALLPLSGGQVNQGSGVESIQSTVAGFELQATSGRAPKCASVSSEKCLTFEDQRSADLKYVGSTSSAPQLYAVGEDPLTSPNGLAYIAVSTHGAWRTVSGIQEFDVYVDGTGDGVADVVMFNTRLTDTDVLVSETVDLNTGDVLDIEALNDALGDTDTAMFNSDSIVLPLAISAIPGVTAEHSRISYAVQALSGYAPGLIDSAGVVNDDLSLSSPLSMDVLHPGLSVAGSYNGTTSPLLYADSPGSVLKVRKNVPAYAMDKGQGALLLHLHNAVGRKAQVAALTSETTVTLAASPNPVRHGSSVTMTARVANTAGVAPTGRVAFHHVGHANFGTATLINGVAKLTVQASAYPQTQQAYATFQPATADYVNTDSPRVALKIT